MTRTAMRGYRTRLIAIAAMVALLGVVVGHRSADAAGTLYFSATVAPADGITTLTATYVGDTTGTSDALGQAVRFSVAPAAGSTATPRFSDGSTTTTVTLVGVACDATQHPPIGLFFTTCYASVQFNSAVAGDVIVSAQNVTSGGALLTSTRSFYGAPSALAPDSSVQSGPLNLAGVGDLSATVARRIASTGAFSGLVTLTTPFRDGGGRAIAGAPVTCLTTLGSFVESGGATVTGLTTAVGQLSSMTLSLTASQVSTPAPGTISCTVNAVTGSLTVSGLVATVGAASQIAMSTDKPVVSGVTGTNDTLTVSITVRDSANNGVTGLETGGGLTLSVAPVGAGAIGAISPSATTPGTYTAIYTPITTVAGNAVDSVTVTARLTSGANLSQTATFAQSGAAATITLIASSPTVAPTDYVLLTATLKDAGGRTVATAGAPTVTFTATGSGNILVPTTSTAAPNGVATGVFIAGSTPGPVTVTVTTATGLGAFRTVTISAPQTTPTAPTQQVVSVTPSGVFCFKYVGPSAAAADLGTFFATNIVAVNQMGFPSGNFGSWFRAAPSLSKITQISNGDVLCVTGAIGTNVFATS